jgi:succinate dehydrogenase/fumarate reductase flavoprotein subunit
MEEERKKCDVLCVGGGVAGMMAAIRAREMGAQVILAEKSNTMRSGGGGMGVDHFFSYIPEYHGNFDDFLKELTVGQNAPTWAMKDKEYIRFLFETSTGLVKLWEQWGVPVKYHGKYYFAGHCFPGQKPSWLKISGLNMKPVLTRQAQEKGVEIINRVMAFDVLKDNDGRLVGAIGISTREDKIVIFEAKAVVLTTGCVSGLYPSPGQDGNFCRAFPILHSGDGRIMAYRAGAELADLELTRRHAGPKYFIRAGQASWVGVLRDRCGKPVGPFLTKPSALYGDMTVEVNKQIFEHYKMSGKGPVYMDMNGISDEDFEEMLHYLRHQGNIAVLDHLVEQGVEVKKAAIEFTTFEHAIATGVLYNHRGETEVKGLYAAGDEYTAGLGASAVIGWSAGENAAQYASTAKAADVEGASVQIRAHEDLIKEIRTRKIGAKWTEAYGAVQEVAEDYCGSIRSEPSLEAGLDVMRRFRARAREHLKADNAHELMYCIQALNLFDLGELLLISANDRKETRGLHVRADYTLTNPMLSGKHHVIKQVDGKPALSWKEVRK